MQIGEGGYAFVYLAKPVPGGQVFVGAAAEPVAIKKVGYSSASKVLVEVLHSIMG